ncbi:MAG: hypothetical protein HQ567_01175 [Candidatus Nealsonbacteria bacterium]|nr:hypothetical protein [Candidatus Nealsonbacteria bacterium]
MIDDNRRAEIQRRWHTIDAELEDIRAGRVVKGGDPATREGKLLEELDSLEFEVGEEYLRER